MEKALRALLGFCFSGLEKILLLSEGSYLQSNESEGERAQAFSIT